MPALKNATQLEAICSSVLRAHVPPPLQGSAEASHRAQLRSAEHQTPPTVPPKEASQEACGKDNYRRQLNLFCGIRLPRNFFPETLGMVGMYNITT